MNKAEVMQRVVSGAAHEAFHHEHCGVFDITDMRRVAAAVAVLAELELTQEVVDFIRDNRVTDPVRVAQLAAEANSEPVMYVYDPADDTHLLIDGAHRLLALAQRGVSVYRAYVFQQDQVLRPQSGWVADPRGDWRGEMAGQKGL